MGYRGELLTDLAPALDRGVRRFGHRTTEKVGDELKRRVRRHTPVARETAAVRASFDSLEHWISSRGGRRPGELRDSWHVGDVDVVVGATGDHFRVPVFTMDPVAPHVEWDTRPHLILPRKPGGVLTIPTRHGMVFATAVHHPGTRGAHMMATALAEIAAEWRQIAAREWARETRRFWRADA